MIKTIIYEADGEPLVALVRGDHEVNEGKLARAAKCFEHSQFNQLGKGVMLTYKGIQISRRCVHLCFYPAIFNFGFSWKRAATYHEV